MAAEVPEQARRESPLLASDITRLDVLAGMRADEERATRLLLSTMSWRPVDEAVAEQAAALGRRWLPSHRSIDAADLAIAATAVVAEANLLTRTVEHFPMFVGLQSPY